MKKYFLIAASLVVFTACTKKDGTTPPPISNPPGPNDIQITGIDITYGYTGDVIQVTGKNFGTDKNAIVVKVNNVTAPIINSVISDISFNVKVPAKCGTGVVTATKAGKTAVGPSFYYIPSVTVTTLYGNCTQASFTNGSGTNMRMNNPTDFVFDKNNNLYVVERGGIIGAAPGSLIRKISASSGQISTFSGGPLGGNTANYNAYWTTSLPSGSGGYSSVNGGEARFNLPTCIGISEDPGSGAFKLFVTQNSFVRIINEATATGVFAGNVKDTVGGGGLPVDGGRHEAHIFPIGEGIVVSPNSTDYGSPTLYFIDHGPRIVKQDVNGNISTLVDLKNSIVKNGFLTRHPDGNLYMQPSPGTGVKEIYKITPAGAFTAWITNTDSLFNKATGKNELFGDLETNGTVRNFTIDKDGNLFLMTAGSGYTDLYKIFPDKSFLRLFEWSAHSNEAADGVNNIAGISRPQKMLVRNNGDIYIIDGFAIRKMSFE